MLCLVRAGSENSLTIPEIAYMEGMTQSHVAKIMAILRKAGFINSTRGQLGGYTLATDPETITLRSLFDSLGGRLFGAEFCERHTGIEATCVHESDCALRPLWNNLQNLIDDFTGKFTLGDLFHHRIPDPLLHLSASGRPTSKTGGE